MDRERDTHSTAGAVASGDRWETPRIEVIPLSCEITSYAPDDGDPLF